ncbi:lasso RiPP family leader peptide-containing protein [Amycolatopsis silviterrae]|uniref:Lasso RiPP family leader peptide-containing protein n=1 Tax=Amycolatopsis silviterrae TaxID=1656914 RepID=A0ABW5H8W3_9PSEU
MSRTSIETIAYEPPTMAEAGDFAEVTLGLPNLGWELDGRCLFACR